MQMILPTTLLLGALGYLFYTSKRELSLDHHDLIENKKENEDLYKDLEDLFIWNYWIGTKELCFLTKDIQNLKHN